jgi:hypothetical protein
MTQRSILAGTNPTVIIKTGASVTVTGVEGERVSAQTGGRWGLKVVRKRKKEVIEVQIGGSGEVTVPLASNLKVYAGKDLHVRDIRGRVDAYAGFKLSLQDVYCLGNASAGWTMDVDCQTLAGEQVTYTAGSDLRFHVQDLTSARLRRHPGDRSKSRAAAAALHPGKYRKAPCGRIDHRRIHDFNHKTPSYETGWGFFSIDHPPNHPPWVMTTHPFES